jgi:organic radical activating enzyme
MEQINSDIFPIKTNTACQFKWTWSTLFLSVGTSSSCHRCKGWDVTNHMQDFHNHPGKLGDREKMLEGLWPGNGCEYCKKIEDAGGKSERNGYINDLLLSPPELVLNPKEIRVTPRILEVYFTNVCNQKCVYCSPFFSSLFQQEIEKYGPIENEYDLMGFKARDDYDKLKADFWIWMENNSTELYQFQILGGEPMYQPEFEECLDYFERKEHPKTNWKIFSNLKHTPSKFKEKIQRINKLIESKKLKSFEIVCSQDSWGPQAEFSRFGMDLKEWEQNFNTLMESPFVGISIHSTISPTTLPTMAEFYRKIMDWNKIRQVNFGWNTIANPTFMSPEILGHYATDFFDELLSVIPDTDHRKIYLEGFKTQVTTHDVDPYRLKKLYDYLEKIDVRRNTDWKSLYPWLVEICNKEITEDIPSTDLSHTRLIKKEEVISNVLKEYRNISDKSMI